MAELIPKKVEGQEITVAPEAPTGKVIDLMEALKAILAKKATVPAEASVLAQDRKPPKRAAREEQPSAERRSKASRSGKA
jgi:DNA end-binding protein Ku